MMIKDLDSNELPASADADVCIIGAGAAGLTIGLRLARCGIDVLILESGGAAQEPAMQALNDCEIAGHRFSGAEGGRFRVLGGSTTQWGGQILPMSPIDFEARSWIKHRGWPISSSEVAGHYRRVIEMIGLGSAIADDAHVWRSVGMDQPRIGNEGAELFFTRWCPEPDFAYLFRDEIARTQNLRCVLHATVTGFLAEGQMVTHACARNLAGRRIDVRAQRFILAIGGIESPRLLLHPLATGETPPWASDLIGRFFQDHPGLTCADIVPRNRAELHRLFDNVIHGNMRYQPRLRLSDETQRKWRLLQVNNAIIFQSNRNEALSRGRTVGKSLLRGRMQLRSLADLFTAGSGIARVAWRTLVQHRGFNFDDLGARLGMQLEQQPDPDSRVTLTDSVDAMGLRRARIDWRIGMPEVETAAMATEIYKRSFEAAGVAKLKIDADVAARSPDLIDRMNDQAHHNGTLRMGISPRDGVVDKNLKTFGTSNFYVCGSSVFPTGSSSNPTHTLLALGLRLADRLLAAEPARGG
jgi:choline dehydrogenase-like flavoprotein